MNEFKISSYPKHDTLGNREKQFPFIFIIDKHFTMTEIYDKIRFFR